MQSEIVAIGREAISAEDGSLILFGEQATARIKTVSVIQNFVDETFVNLTRGDQIIFGEQVYTIVEIGRSVNENLRMLGHCIVYFQPEEQQFTTAMELEPHRFPRLDLHMPIYYRKRDEGAQTRPESQRTAQNNE